MTRHGVVTAELVGRRFFWRPAANDYGKWAAYRRLRALRELGLILSNKPYADQPAVLGIHGRVRDRDQGRHHQRPAANRCLDKHE